MACTQHHLFLGSGLQQRLLRQNVRYSSFCFDTRTISQRWRSSPFSSPSAVSSLNDKPDDASSSSTNPSLSPSRRRRRGQIPPEWEELSKPDPQPPNYLLLAAGFCLVYLTRQAVAEELVQWASILAIAGLSVMRFVQRLLTVVLVKALLLVKLPITWVLTLAGWSALFARNFYSVVVKTTSVWQTSKILLLLTLVMSIGEATNATAVSGQPWPFVIATAIGVGAVWGLLHHTILVLLLLLLMLYLFVVQKKDSVSAALPSTAVLIALAEPPLKAVAMILYLATAIYTHWRTPKEESSSPASDTRIVQPLFMVIAAVFVGLTAGSRYYTAWNTLWLAKG